MAFLTRPLLRPRTISPGLAILLGLGGLGLDPRPAQAHAIESSLERLQSLNQQLQLHSHFSSGMPLDGAAVRLIPPGGGEGVLVGRTDGRGQLRFRLPQGVDQAWEVQVDGGAGHRDYLEVPASPAAGQPAAISQGRRHDLLKGGLAERTAPLLAALLLGLIATSRGRRR